MSGMELPGEKSQNNAKICCKIVSLDVSGRAGLSSMVLFVWLALFIAIGVWLGPPPALICALVWLVCVLAIVCYGNLVFGHGVWDNKKFWR